MLKKLILICAAGAMLIHANMPVKSGILRLHVIGNSNSLYDQQVKLKVKDEISMVMANNGVKTYEEAVRLVEENETLITDIANRVLKENGADYTAAMETGVFDFPEKTYGAHTFKAGKYHAVRLKLGKAEGENWWCVLFPPLCFLDSTNGEWDLNSEEAVEFKSILAEALR